MKSAIRVAAPPPKPLFIYDGDCAFCTRWVKRWHHTTSELVDYLPFQDPQIAKRFPEIPREAFDSSAQLIELDGSVYSGAEAVFRSLSRHPHYHWPLDIYEVAPILAGIAEWCYRFVARNRKCSTLSQQRRSEKEN